MTDKSELGEILGAISNSFKEERRKKEPYKELFKAGSSLTGLLRSLDHSMSGHALDAVDVMEERLGVKANKVQYNMLLALPLLVQVAKKQAAQEGHACSVDKAFFILSEQLLALSDTPT